MTEIQFSIPLEDLVGLSILDVYRLGHQDGFSGGVRAGLAQRIDFDGVPAPLSTSVEDISFGVMRVKAYNFLVRAQIPTIVDLLQYSIHDLMDRRGYREGVIEGIQAWLEPYGYQLRFGEPKP